VETELAALAATTSLTITVRHLPPGTSKWTRSSTDCSAHLDELARTTPDLPRSDHRILGVYRAPGSKSGRACGVAGNM
jgi:Rhodopirellula transposase DDE domain